MLTQVTSIFFTEKLADNEVESKNVGRQSKDINLLYKVLNSKF